jgi:hypothetical protein
MLMLSLSSIDVNDMLTSLREIKGRLTLHGLPLDILLLIN